MQASLSASTSLCLVYWLEHHRNRMLCVASSRIQTQHVAAKVFFGQTTDTKILGGRLGNAVDLAVGTDFASSCALALMCTPPEEGPDVSAFKLRPRPGEDKGGGGGIVIAEESAVPGKQ
eukprot:3765586-Amphidinium_carterae.1